MSFVDDVDRFADRYRRTPADRLKLQIQALLVKLYWFAADGKPFAKRIAAPISNLIAHCAHLSAQR